MTSLGSNISLGGPTEDAQLQRCVVIVATGTSSPEGQKAYSGIDRQVRAAFPEAKIAWSYTSRIIRAKLATMGKQCDSPEMVFARLMAEGNTHAGVLSLHVIPGQDFHDLAKNVRLFEEMAGGFDRILLAAPLLNSNEDLERVASAVLSRVPTHRKPEDAVVLMGHGSKTHPSDTMYTAMNCVLQEKDPNAYIATVNGHREIRIVMQKLAENRIKRVFLMPFMAVAGKHVREDMAGDKRDSWKTILRRNGFQTDEILVGLGEYPEIVDVWMDHLRATFSEF